MRFVLLPELVIFIFIFHDFFFFCRCTASFPSSCELNCLLLIYIFHCASTTAMATSVAGVQPFFVLFCIFFLFLFFVTALRFRLLCISRTKGKENTRNNTQKNNGKKMSSSHRRCTYCAAVDAHNETDIVLNSEQ